MEERKGERKETNKKKIVKNQERKHEKPKTKLKVLKTIRETKTKTKRIAVF